MSTTLETEAGTMFDYDLNIYHMEEEVGLDADGFPIYEYTDQWYVDIYDYTTNDYGGGQMEHVTGPFKIASQQRDLLQLGEEGWDDDSWYGMWGFLADYDGKLLPELLSILQSLPRYREEVLF